MQNILSPLLDHLEIESIPVAMRDGIVLPLYIAKPPMEKFVGLRPAILVLHGLGGHGRELAAVMTMKNFTERGYFVFSYDMRAAGAPPEHNSLQSMMESLNADYFTKIFNDPDEIMSFIVNYPNIDVSNIHVVGGSLGGAIALGSLLDHPNVKKLVGMSAPYDYKTLLYDLLYKGSMKNRVLHWVWRLRMKNFRKFVKVCREISPISKIKDAPPIPYSERVYLIHSKKDAVVNFSTQFMLNKEKMRIPDSHLLVFDEGDHSLVNQYEFMQEKIAEWLIP